MLYQISAVPADQPHLNYDWVVQGPAHRRGEIPDVVIGVAHQLASSYNTPMAVEIAEFLPLTVDRANRITPARTIWLGTIGITPASTRPQIPQSAASRHPHRHAGVNT